MTYRYHCNRPHPNRGETIINNHRLDELLRKERAHDDYLEAIRAVRFTGRYVGQIHGQAHGDGYRQAMIDLADAVVRVTASRLDDHETMVMGTAESARHGGY